MDTYKILRSIVRSKLCLPLNTGMIINNKPVKEYLDEKLRNKNCIGSWEAGEGDSVLLYAIDKTHLSLLEEIMKQTFVANTLDFVGKIKETSNHGKWLKFVKSLKEEFPDSHFIGENTIVVVDAVVNDIKSKIDNFEQSIIWESYISMTFEHFLFLKEFNEQKINEFSERNKMKTVCFKDNKLHLEGTQNQIKEMETFIENIRKDISSQEVNFEMFGFEEFVKSEERKNLLCEMQKKSESIISLNSDLGSETDEILNFVYKNCEIMLREGDITTLDTDAIVNAANGRLKHGGGIAADIVQKGGFEIQVESDKIIEQRWNELKPGEVVSTKAGKLKCKTIIHAVGPVWNNGQTHELFHLSRAVQNCLAFLDGKSYTSIAIPAINTGIFDIPLEEGIKCTVTTVKNYIDFCSNSKIKQICLIDARKEVIRAFKNHLETVFGISESRGTTSSNASLSGSLQRSSSMTSTTDSESEEDTDVEINLMIDSISDASITGDANEEQILLSLQTYQDRSSDIIVALNSLYNLFLESVVRNQVGALDAILSCMKQHPKDLQVQILGSASLFYIVKGEQMAHAPRKLRKKAIDILLDAMENRYDEQTMLRNGFLILCHFDIPHEVLYCYKRLVKILLGALTPENQDHLVQYIGISLLNCLVSQVDLTKKRMVGELGVIYTMLSIVRQKLECKVCDETLEVSWSTMWNVTDETPSNCEKFMDGDGMELFIQCLKEFPENPKLLRNMMGLMGNISEVKYLRPRLMNQKYISKFSELLNSTSDGIEVSCNIAEFLSHIACDGAEAWIIDSPRRKDVLKTMVGVIESWDISAKRNISYRSFEPILRLVQAYDTPEAQHWAVWALCNLTRVYPERYCSLLEKESGVEILLALKADPRPYSRIKELASKVVNQITENKNKPSESKEGSASHVDSEMTS